MGPVRSQECTTKNRVSELYLASRVHCRRIQHALQTEDAHASEVSCWVVALETNLCPLPADPSLQGGPWHHLIPQLCKLSPQV